MQLQKIQGNPRVTKWAALEISSSLLMVNIQLLLWFGEYLLNLHSLLFDFRRCPNSELTISKSGKRVSKTELPFTRFRETILGFRDTILGLRAH